MFFNIKNLHISRKMTTFVSTKRKRNNKGKGKTLKYVLQHKKIEYVNFI